MDVDWLLRRERAVVAAGLVLLVLLAWAYVWQGAGMGSSAVAMTRLALFPHLQHEAMASMAAPDFGWALIVAMWWVMMVAMMMPSAAPLVLLYTRVLHHVRASASSAYAPAGLLVAGYLLAWLGFSVVAATAQQLLVIAGLVSPNMLWSDSAPLSAAVLAAAGVYQLSPLKGACLRHCRGPVEFLTQHWRPGWFGALRMGLRNGVYCVGCCWILMAMLFVGGVMNVAWIAALTLLVLVEKVAPSGEAIGKIAGGVLLAWAGATLLV